MSDKIKLDIISDVVCPWCVVGYKRLQAAIEAKGLSDRVEIEWQPFELNPDMPAEGENLRDHIMRKYGSSAEDSANARLNITAQGAESGFEFRFFDEMNMVNTLDAHVLLDFAHQQQKQTELKLRLFSAYFSEGKDVSKIDVLLDEAQAVGLDRAQAQQALENPETRGKIRALEQQWHQMGVTGVPTVVFNRTSALTGAHPQDTYEQVLQELLDA